MRNRELYLYIKNLYASIKSYFYLKNYLNYSFLTFNDF